MTLMYLSLVFNCFYPFITSFIQQDDLIAKRSLKPRQKVVWFFNDKC